jgi:hypothetical protein
MTCNYLIITMETDICCSSVSYLYTILADHAELTDGYEGSKKLQGHVSTASHDKGHKVLPKGTTCYASAKGVKLLDTD